MIRASCVRRSSKIILDKGRFGGLCTGYDKIREDIESRNALPMIPMRKNRKVRKVVDMTIYTLRNMVERCFNKLKNSRRLATRYDKTADSFLGFIDIACIRLWLRHLST